MTRDDRELSLRMGVGSHVEAERAMQDPYWTEWLETGHPYRGDFNERAALLSVHAMQAAARERARICAILRTAPRASGVLINIDSAQDLARMADDIEQGKV